MKTEITRTVTDEVDIRFLKIEAGVRYWEDATVNGVEDTDGSLIPFRVGDIWNPIIDVDSGCILDWPEGVEAKVHYKVCDAGSYYLSDVNGNVVLHIEDDYVPNSLIPGEYGDYIIMTINGSGSITEWPSTPNLSDFLNHSDDD